jgi:hypothetical protein
MSEHLTDVDRLMFDPDGVRRVPHRRRRMNEHLNDTETLAEELYRKLLVRQNANLYTAAVLASDWLREHDAALARDRAALAAKIARAWDDGYNDAATMARCYGHTDHWPAEDEPRNPYRAALAGPEGTARDTQRDGDA